MIAFTIKESGDRGHINRLARHVAGILIPANPAGFTFDPLTFQSPPVFGSKIFPNINLASIEGHDRIFSAIPAFDEIRNWIANNYERFCISGNYIGFWKNAERFYLDVTQAIVGLNRALAVGRANIQHSIHHPYTEEDIPIDYDDAGILSGSNTHRESFLVGPQFVFADGEAQRE